MTIFHGPKQRGSIRGRPMHSDFYVVVSLCRGCGAQIRQYRCPGVRFAGRLHICCVCAMERLYPGSVERRTGQGGVAVLGRCPGTSVH